MKKISKGIIAGFLLVALVAASGCRHLYDVYAGRWSAVATDAGGQTIDFFQFTITALPGRMLVCFILPDRYMAEAAQSEVTGSLVLPYARHKYLVLDTYHVQDGYFSGFTFADGQRSGDVVAVRMQDK